MQRDRKWEMQRESKTWVRAREFLHQGGMSFTGEAPFLQGSLGLPCLEDLSSSIAPGPQQVVAFAA